ncbi:MAG: hypothetical protein LBH06_08880 [Rikenellaceae bacterium]|nr:hypothetical protein [Rikenellaceae bacterium]
MQHLLRIPLLRRPRLASLASQALLPRHSVTLSHPSHGSRHASGHMNVVMRPFREAG